MKNKLYSIIFFGLLLSSCGTSTYFASASYDDAIYYNPSEQVLPAKDFATDQKLAELRNKTRSIVNLQINNNTENEIIVNNEDDTVYIEPYESYEELLTKFDNSRYDIEITIVDDGDYYDSWWPTPYWRYGWYNPWYHGYRNWWSFNGWYYNPWFYSYYDPWGFWYDPWYYGYGPYSWYYPGYYGYWNYGGYYPWYNGGGYYAHNDGRDIYHGRRSGYGDVTSGGGNNSVRSGGSYLRRDAVVEQVSGSRSDLRRGSEMNVYQGNGENSAKGSIYRRENNQSANRISSSSSGVIHNTGVVNTRTTTYERSSGNVKSENTNSGKTTVYRRSGQGTSSSQYRPATTSKDSNSGTANRSSGSSSYERSSGYIKNTYSPPANSSSSSSSSSSTSSGGNSGNSGRSGGSTYRR
jgi:hypothetical protein